ncbi:MAG TPA: hypothetical protein VL282_01185 [Tepidisphaeraceae bacterium]|jgi:hypothetical protein|nr:hypothetical protein [Tepidisphaeraceae bacterium]
MKEWLVIFGWLFVLASGALILIPYLRRKQDLLTSWTLFMFGSMNFVGFAAIQSGKMINHLYTTPNADDYANFIFGACVFYAVAIVTYYFIGFPKTLSRRFMRKWPPRSPSVMIKLMPVCVVFVLGMVFVPNVQLVGQLMLFFGLYGAIYAVVFMFSAWHQRPFNLVLLCGVIVAIGVALVVTNTGYGRRDFLSVIVTVPLCWYWLSGRNRGPIKVLGLLAGWGVVAMIALAGVSLIRGSVGTPGAGFMQNAVAKVKAIPLSLSFESNSELLFGGDAVEASLASIHYYAVRPTHPFFTLGYVLANPIPRAWWPDKPEALGQTLAKDIGYVTMHGQVNFGPGIVGHGFHEGGIWILAIYGFLFSAIWKFFDSLLVEDPDNPYLIGILGSVSGQVLAFARGDIGLFWVLIFAGFLTGMLIRVIARILFGTETVLPHTVTEDQLLEMLGDEYHAPVQAQWENSY